MTSTIETLERELGEAQREKDKYSRAVVRAENAHEAVCSARDDAWSESFATDPEVERLSKLVYQRRRELYEAIDCLKAAEGKERRIKSRLMYVLPAERRRYLAGEVDAEFDAMLRAIRRAHYAASARPEVRVVTEQPGEVDLRGDATWRALERLYSGTLRRWVEIQAREESGILEMARLISYYAGGHVPRVFIGGEEARVDRTREATGGHRLLPDYDNPEGRLSLARITVRRYLDESCVTRLEKRSASFIKLADIARLYQTMNLTGDEIRWRLEQLVSLRLEILEAVHTLTGQRRRFSFYEIARAARLLDAHFPDAGVAAEVLLEAVERALRTSVPLVDVAYLNVTSGEEF